MYLKGFLGCFEIQTINQYTIKKKIPTSNNTVEECYLECIMESISCGTDKQIYFVLQVTVQIILNCEVKILFISYYRTLAYKKITNTLNKMISSKHIICLEKKIRLKEN